MNNSSAIIPGSLQAIAQTTGKALAETFLNVDAIVIMDVSGSMSDNDSRDGKSRYDVACEELTQLQATLPGKIAVISFSSTVQFNPSGVPAYLGGLTDLTAALQYVKAADKINGMRFILISDGEPNSKEGAMEVARKYQNHIDVIYVGPEDRPTGRNFLTQLASVTGGKSITADVAKKLADSIQYLLAAG